MIFDKVLFVDEDGVAVEYDHGLHSRRIRRFLGWPGLLIAGPQSLHSFLYTDFSQNCSDAPSTEKLNAAGITTPRGVIHWWSTGYDFDTPEEMKPQVLEALIVEDIS